MHGAVPSAGAGLSMRWTDLGAQIHSLCLQAACRCLKTAMRHAILHAVTRSMKAKS